MSNEENVCPQVLRGVARELRQLAAAPPAGVKLLPGAGADLTDVRALIEGPAGTPYAGGRFVARLALGREYPRVAPRAFFLTPLFHPNVAWRSGEVCVDTLRGGWGGAGAGAGLAHALLALRCLLIAPNAESALNAEAAALLRDRYHDYFARARLLTDIHAAPESGSGDCSAATGGETSAPAPEGPAGAAGGPAGEVPATVGPAGSEPAAESATSAGPRAKRQRPPADKRRVLKRL